MSVTKEQMSTLRAGDRLKFSFGANYPGNFILHVVAFVMDGTSRLTITKRWNKHKQRWNYTVDDTWLLVPSWEHITLVRKRRSSKVP